MSVRSRGPRSIAVLIALALAGLWAVRAGVGSRFDAPPAMSTHAPTAQGADDLERVHEAFAERRGDLWVTLAGRVERTLRDDDEGSRHQRFVLRLDDDLTLLVAHNIDLAERVPLEVGDEVRLRGKYEWNAQGGVLHWTHHDPGGGPGGWIECSGRRYE